MRALLHSAHATPKRCGRYAGDFVFVQNKNSIRTYYAGEFYVIKKVQFQQKKKGADG
jgi:hypothetical protein